MCWHHFALLPPRSAKVHTRQSVKASMSHAACSMCLSRFSRKVPLGKFERWLVQGIAFWCSADQLQVFHPVATGAGC